MANIMLGYSNQIDSSTLSGVLGMHHFQLQISKTNYYLNLQSQQGIQLLSRLPQPLFVPLVLLKQIYLLVQRIPYQMVHTIAVH